MKPPTPEAILAAVEEMECNLKYRQVEGFPNAPLTQDQVEKWFDELFAERPR